MNREGFTLIEMIIILTLISIIFSIAYPNRNFYRSIKEKREMEEFRKDLLFARNKAIVESRDYMVYFHLDENGYEIRKSENSPIFKKKTFQYGLKLEPTNLVKSFTFKSNGTTTGGNTLYFRDSYNNKYKVTLTPATGRVTFFLDKENGGKI